MPINEVLASAPYHAPFHPEKNHAQVLFKSGYATQTRELIEMQSILQNQIGQFADHVFTNGSRVLGGEVVRKTLRFYRLQPDYQGSTIYAEDWVGRRITGAVSGQRAVVVAAVDAEDGDPPTIYVEFDLEFVGGIQRAEKVTIDGSGIAALVEDSTGFVGSSLYVGVNTGVYYIEGKFVHVPDQAVLASKYSAEPTGEVGLEYSESINTVEDDPDLRDTSRGARNYNAPGADRLVVNCTLRYFDTPQQELPDNFISLLGVEDGVVKEEATRPIYAEIAEEFARRTYDESGDYTVRPFELTPENHVGVKLLSITHSGGQLSHEGHVLSSIPHKAIVGDQITIRGASGPDGEIYNGTHVVTAVDSDHEFTYSLPTVPVNDAEGESIVVERDDYFTAAMSPGKAYVRGFEVERVSTSNIDVPRARTSRVVQNYSAAAAYGGYLIVENLNGIIDESLLEEITLKNGTDDTIGTARVRHVTNHSSDKWRVYLYDFSLIGTEPLALVESLSGDGGNTTATVAQESKDPGGKTRLLGAGLTGLVFTIPESEIKTLQPTGISDTSYTFRKRFESATSGSDRSVTFAVTGQRFFLGPVGLDLSDSTIISQNYIFFDAQTGAPVYPESAIIGNSGKEITLEFGSGTGFVVSMTAAISENRAAARTKTIVTETVDVSYGEGSISLGAPDGIELISMTMDGVDVSSNFRFDGGQRDDFYDHAYIERSRSVPDAEQGDTITVVFTRFEHSGEGFFSVDSYAGIDRSDIPEYTSKATGQIHKLTDVLDFRPTKIKNGTAHVGGRVPVPNSVVTSDFEFYLPRRDRVVMDKAGSFRVVTGEPSLTPFLPAEPDDAMTLYELSVPAYTHDATVDVQVKYIDNKRYTMKDIGRIDRRVDRLEYYTALSLLESDTKASTVTDAEGLDRFKSGFLVDGFTGHRIGDVRNADYSCSIDPENRELRPPFASESRGLVYSAESTGVKQVGNDDIGYFATLPYTGVPYVSHDFASKAQSINPYLVISMIGSINCNPPSDDWVDTSRRPAVRVDLTGDQDAWNFMARAVTESAAPGFGTQWNDWQTTWTGASTTAQSRTNAFRTAGGTQTNVTTDFTTVTTRNQIRRGTQTNLGFSTISQSTGDRVVDVNLAHWMRPITLRLHGFGLRPNTDLHAFVDDTKVNGNTFPGAGVYVPQGEGCLRTDSTGQVVAFLNIPAGTFRTGERNITLTDEQNKVEQNATTYASYIFASSGLLQTKQEAIISTRVPTLTTSAVSQGRSLSSTSVRTTTQSTFVTDPPPPPPVQQVQQFNFDNGGGGEGQGFGPDPFAQTFKVSKNANPRGVFLDSVDLFFKRKPTETEHPVEVHVRPTVNGFPHSSKIIPMSQVLRTVGEVNIPNNTDEIASVRAAATTFTFPVPIYLAPGEEYAIIVLSADSEYEAYIAEMGQRVIGTQSVISKQPSLGSLFKSQNASTWSPTQNEDLMMVLNRCSFDVDAVATVISESKEGETLLANLMMHSAGILNLEPSTSVNHSVKIKDEGTRALPIDWQPIPTAENFQFESEKIVAEPTDLRVQTIMTTEREDVAPLFDLTRNSAILVRNIVNDFGLLKKGVEIVERGEGYTYATIQIDGVGAGALLEPVIENGQIVDVTVAEEGRDFETPPTLTVNGDGTGAIVRFTGVETDSSDGNCQARYMTRRVTLAGDWESDFAEVKLDANKPAGTEVRVYAKYSSVDDPLPFDTRPWVEMQLDTDSPLIPSSVDDFREHTFIPAGGTLSYESQGVQFSRIKTMSVKIVMTSINTSTVPRVRDLRVIWAAP